MWLKNSQGIIKYQHTVAGGDERNTEEVAREIVTQGTVLVQLERPSRQYQQIERDLNLSIVPHHDSALGGNFTKFEVVEIQKIINRKVLERYLSCVFFNAVSLAEEESKFSFFMPSVGLDERNLCKIDTQVYLAA